MSVFGASLLEPASRALLGTMAEQPWAGDMYLAGSAGLCCHLGHRPVRDLDLMTGVNRLRSADRRELLQDLLAMDSGVRVETARDGFLYVRSGAGVALRFYYFPYPMVESEEEIEGFPLAPLVDLGLMKLGAIISRGGRRDFVDTYLICQRFPLEDLLARAPEKFGHVGDFPLQALKGMADLEAARAEPMPRLAEPLDWASVELWASTEIRRLGRQQVGLA